MKRIQIHQFSPSAHLGDGITNGMFYLQNILQELGFVSKIYAENFETELDNKVFHYTKINKKNKNQLLFVHYSIYYDFDTWINKLECKKVMIYHNITPYEFFQKESLLYNMCKKGIEYLPDLATKVVGAIGDSPLNSSELLEHNFKNVKTIPLLMDTQKIVATPFNHALFDEKVEEFSIIFVGRIAKNKAQHDLIEIARHYSQICDDFHLYIIGSTTDQVYAQELQALIHAYSLEEYVTLTGKVSNEDLYAYYRSANLFLCMSEHEGFGIPLIESMLFDTPVIAYNSSNIKNTLNKGGILINEKNHKYIAALIHLLRENVAFKTEILNTQRKARQIYAHDKIVKELVSYLHSIDIFCDYTAKEKQKELLFQFEGPFDSSYSLAMLNRYAAESLDKLYPNQVALFSTEGHGDFTPNQEFLQKHPNIQKMASLAKKAAQCQVVFRNLYPPRVSGMKGELNILNAYGWEESAFVKEYVDNFNEHLDGITVMSVYVKNVLKINGVKTPISVVGLGAEHILQTKPIAVALKTEKKFKFLHISSCFARKGVDVLLKAYSEAFSNEDDICLIIKTFPNPHNDVAQQIQTLKKSKPNAPEIILINEDLPEGCIPWLYQNCDALVAPSRGEGFGLPMAEAMLFDLPVITTAFGGQSDFCTNETAWLIDYSYKKAQTHLHLFNSYWAEPSEADLTKLLKELYNLPQEEKRKRTNKAKELITQKFSWKCYADNTLAFIEKLKNRAVFDTTTHNIAWVSSFNTKCGIATYSDFILQELSQDKFHVNIFANETKEVIDPQKETTLTRCWNNRFDADNTYLYENIMQTDPDHVVINFNFGFFSMQNLQTLLEKFHTNNVKTTLIFHSVADVTIKGLEASLGDIKESLQKANHLLVHNIDDLNRLKNIGCTNIDLLPHGIKQRETNPPVNKSHTFTIASYGFLLPHKGILELIEAFSIVVKSYPHAKLSLVNALYPVPDSQNYYTLCQDKVKALKLTDNIEFMTDFLSDDESFKLLDSADILVLPYRKTNESSSAAVRYALSTLKPVLCTPQSIFNDVQDVVFFTQGFTPQEMATSIEKLMRDEVFRTSKLQLQQRWIIEHDWRNIAKKIENYLD